MKTRITTSPGFIEERYYDPSIVSNKFAVGERIEWSEFSSDSTEGSISIFNTGIIKKITPWTVLLEVDDGVIGQGIEKRFDKSYLLSRSTNWALQEAIETSLEVARETKKSQQQFPPAETPSATTQQCFVCEKHYSIPAFEKHPKHLKNAPILTEVCHSCYRRTKAKISAYSSEARRNGGQTGLTVAEWLTKLKASQGHCTYCQEYLGIGSLIIEHRMPLSLRGSNTIENVVPACISCNSSKGDRDYETWMRHEEAHTLLIRLQEHLGLSKFETINFAIKHLAIHEGLINEDSTEAAS